MKGYCFLTLKLMCLKRTVSPTDSSATTHHRRNLSCSAAAAAAVALHFMYAAAAAAAVAAAGSGGIAQTAMAAPRAAYRRGRGRGAPWMKLLTAPGGL